jgi:hypothetical protein
LYVVFPLNTFEKFFSGAFPQICCNSHHFIFIKGTKDGRRPIFWIFILNLILMWFISLDLYWNSFLQLFKQILPSDVFCWKIIIFLIISCPYELGEWYRLYIRSPYIYCNIFRDCRLIVMNYFFTGCGSTSFGKWSKYRC